MSKPCTIAKAIAIDAEFAGKIITGTIDHSGEALWLDGFHVSIAPHTLCYNTGFVDADDNEIFEGDYIQPVHGDTADFVYFDADRGAFCTSHIENLPNIEYNGDDEVRYCEYPNATVIRRLTAWRAKQYVVVRNMLEGLITPSPLDDIDAEPVDVTQSDPDLDSVDGADFSYDAAVDTIPPEPFADGII